MTAERLLQLEPAANCVADSFEQWSGGSTIDDVVRLQEGANVA